MHMHVVSNSLHILILSLVPSAVYTCVVTKGDIK